MRRRMQAHPSAYFALAALFAVVCVPIALSSLPHPWTLIPAGLSVISAISGVQAILLRSAVKKAVAASPASASDAEEALPISASTTAYYRAYDWETREMIFVTVAIFALMGLAVLAAGIRDGSLAQMGFGVLVVAGGVFNYYQLGGRIGSALSLSDGMLTCVTPNGRSTTKPLSSLRSVRPSIGPTAALLFSDGSQIRIRVRKGFGEFMAIVQEQQPLVEVHLSPYALRAENAWWTDSGCTPGPTPPPHDA